MKKILAIQSLQCADHAMNVPPTVLTVNWFLSKRCNYDCSYCGPHNHDAISPYVDIDRAFNTIEKFQSYADSHGKKIKWQITGGEPFVDPAINRLLKKIHSHRTIEQLNAISNGSLPFEHYQKSLEYLKGLTISLHFERSEDELAKTLATILKLHQTQKSFINVNVMLLPGKLEIVKSAVEFFQQYGIAFVVRKISPPWTEQKHLPWVATGIKKRDKNLLDITEQSLAKQEWISINDTTRHSRNDYYSSDELSYLQTINQKISWNNVRVWTNKKEYVEINTDQILSESQHSFTGWTCYAGVDSVYVDFDGQIYRGMCLDGGAIDSFVDYSTECSRQWCYCNQDITVRKCSSTEYQGLIT